MCNFITLYVSFAPLWLERFMTATVFILTGYILQDLNKNVYKLWCNFDCVFWYQT